MEVGWYKGKEASKILKVHPKTLYNWDEKGLIETKRTNTNIRYYNVNKYLRDNNLIIENNETINEDTKINEFDEFNDSNTKLNIIYARVSSYGQKDDLERQIKYLKTKYPNYTLIKDIGSGINLNRRGLRKIIDLAIKGKIKKLVIAHKDRLVRFGFELIEDLIKDYSKGEIIILEKKKKEEPEEELVKDLLQIMNIFTAKMNGIRKYKLY